MLSDMPPASGMRRALAVFVDSLVFIAIWAVVGIVVVHGSVFYALALFLLVDILLTAFLGLSPGRFVTRIRVVRATDGGPPGLRAALVRTGLVLITGWLGLFVYLIRLRIGDEAPPRMWWDSAAGTQLVAAAAAHTTSESPTN